MGLIKWCRSLQIMDLWKLKSYYRALMTRGSHAFPWKSIWRVKVPSEVAFFTWTGEGKDSHFGKFEEEYLHCQQMLHVQE